jgi:diadenylate cyclase
LSGNPQAVDVVMFVPFLEIFIISLIIYYLLSFFWNTRAMDLLYGILAFLTLYAVVYWLQLPVLQKLMYYFVNVAVIALLIIFQPELRLALSKLSVKGKKYKELTEFDKFLNGMTHCIYRLAEKKMGAIVLLENQDSLDEWAKKSVVVNANFSPELLETIFSPTTPLHDGAVIISGMKIISASTILPLSDDTSQLSKSMGTRHRAALGISQLSDALVIVVSEETGRVAIARDGIMTRGVKMDRFKGILGSIFNPPQMKFDKPFNLFERIKRWFKSE